MAAPQIRGGDKIRAKLQKLVQAAKSGTVRIGFLENATYPQSGVPVAMVAALQEFGAPKANIPPRPFFRTLVQAKKQEWKEAIRKLLEGNDYDTEKTLMMTGEAIKGQLQQSIRDVHQPALSPVTLMLRKMFGNSPHLIRRRDVWEAIRKVKAGDSSAGVSAKPLIWTGHMLNSVDYEVRMK
jgi:hypothetical protein